MRSGDRSSGDVSEQGRRIDHTPKREAADGPCVASVTSLNLLGQDERPERRGDPPVQRLEGGETWVHIGNPSAQGRAQG